MTWRFHFPLRNYDFNDINIETNLLSLTNLGWKKSISRVQSALKVKVLHQHAEIKHAVYINLVF